MRTLLIALLLAGCATPGHDIKVTERLMANTVQVDSIRLNMEEMKKAKRLTAQQERPVAALVNLADEAGHAALLSVDGARSSRLLDMADFILKEARELLAATTERREDAAENLKPKPKGKP